ncbi:unnamed protein product [Adineta steineri]|uniref:Uncharacterized protein n=1 Tax=Adineta steineri TaxID=433720 RepID=A0A814KU88_9BILA|nr:unnamed protein product [Adineta steineri]
MITQALKAFAHLGDLRRGINMHHTISSRINNDSYIFASLIHFYRTAEASNLAERVSKTILQLFYSNPHLLTSLLDALMKCAQLLFNRSTSKILSIYEATMNEYNKDKNPSKTLNLFYQMK